MSKFHVFLIFCLGLVIVCCETTFLLHPRAIKPPVAVPVPVVRPDNAEFAEIQTVNRYVAGIRSLACDNVEVTLVERLTIHLKGVMYYEKPKNFRMLLSLRQTEVDIGSNNTLFWYWSRRMKPAATFYCDHAHVMNTRLRNVFHPMWIVKCLGLDAIPAQGVHTCRDGNQMRVTEDNRIITLVNLSDHSMGRHILQEGGRVIATSDVQEWQNVDGYRIPKILRLTWYEEGVELTIQLNAPKVNCGIAPGAWQMPDRGPQINLLGY